MIHDDNIIALATPSGAGAIAVVRISGKDAINICSKFFKSVSGKDLIKQKTHTIHLGHIMDGTRTIDEVLVSVFKNPNSYTGENVVEISSHGSPYIQQEIIQLFLRNSCRMATAGEFTLRAFLNGKLDLSQAEAVADLIASDNEASHKIAMQQMRGGFSSEIAKLREELLNFASLIELELDFAEEDVEFADRKQFKDLLERISFVLKRLIDSFAVGNVIKNGIPVAIVGVPNVGKSTLTNRILGEERVVVYDMPGTTRDSIYIPMERDGREYVLIDTAGVRRRGRINETVEKFSVVKTLKAVEDANVVLLVIDARENISDQDLSLLGFALNAGRSIVLAVNKWDGLDNEVKENVKKELDRRLGFVDFARIHFISALHGTGVGHLFESIQEAYKSATTRVGTSVLTRIMKMATDDHQPPMVRGRRIKLKYAHAGGYNPPIVVVHGNMVRDLPDSYKRYLMNYFRKSLEIMGTPIRINFQNSDNPYENRGGKLTLSQERKRKRMMSAVKNRNK